MTIERSTVDWKRRRRRYEPSNTGARSHDDNRRARQETDGHRASSEVVAICIQAVEDAYEEATSPKKRIRKRKPAEVVNLQR